MKPILFTLIVAVGLVIFFVGNYNGYKHDAESDNKPWSLSEWFRLSLVLMILSIVFFLPSLNISEENIRQFEETASDVTMGALKGSTGAILGALLWGMGIPIAITRTIIPILTKAGVITTPRQKNREKLK